MGNDSKVVFWPEHVCIHISHIYVHAHIYRHTQLGKIHRESLDILEVKFVSRQCPPLGQANCELPMKSQLSRVLLRLCSSEL